MKIKSAILSVFLASTMLFTAIPTAAATAQTSTTTQTVTITILDTKNTKSTNDDSKFYVKVNKGSKIPSEDLQKIDTWVKQGSGRTATIKAAFNTSLSSADSKALKGKISGNKTMKVQYKQINPIVNFYDTVSKEVYATKVPKKGETVSYPEPPKHDGCVFDTATGWSIKKGTKFTSAKTYTVKANYKQVTYVIQFDGKGSTSGTMNQTKKIKYTDKFVLPANKYKKTGYIFKGWKMKGNGNYIYKDKSTVSKLTNKENAVVVFEAVWEVKDEPEYKITYKLNGADPINNNPKTYKSGDTIKLTNPKAGARTGYVFTGWTYGSKTNPIMNVDIRNAKLGNVVFTANWEPIVYYIQFNGNGATSGTVNRIKLKYGIKPSDSSTWVTLPKNNFAKTGYIFDGWEYNGNKYADQYTFKYNVTEKAQTLTFKARWIPNQSAYTITYNLDGGDDKGKNPLSYTPNTKTFKLTAPTRVGFVFEGWAGTDIDDVQKTVTVPFGSNGDREYTAIWRPIEYIIVFNKNNSDKDGLGKMDQVTVKYDEEFTLPNCEYSRTRYDFDHWEFDKKIYEDGATVSGLASKNGQKVTLKAIWIIKSEMECQLNFKINGGELYGNTNPNPVFGPIGGTITLDDPVPPPKKAFSHWTCSGNGTIDGDTFTFGEGLTNKNATVSAVYVKAE